MSAEGSGATPPAAAPVKAPSYGRYVGGLALLILALITVNTIVTKPNGVRGIAPGQRLAPFAVPLATGRLGGDANVATHADQGSAGGVPACAVRGAQVLNVCQLYARGPVVLALFIPAGSCAGVLSDMQSVVRSFPGVQFAAVAIRSDSPPVRREISRRGLSFPVGVDRDGALAAVYRLGTCPQVSFALPGGVVQSAALLTNPGPQKLRERVQQLVAAARADGWRPPAKLVIR